MQHRSSMQRAVARLSSFVRRAQPAWLLLVLLAMSPGVAWAQQCTTMNVPDANTVPSTSPMASGGRIDILIGDICDGFGLNPYPSTHTVAPQHGSVSVDTGPGTVTYTNNGDGATSDSFVVEDASGYAFTINVAIGAATSPISVTPGTLTAPHVGSAYSQTLSATGGTAPYTYALTGGSLPPGLALAGSTISGTPTQAGSYTATFTITDNASLSTTKSYTVTVPNPSSGIGIAAPPVASLNVPYSHALSASGALAPYTFALYAGASTPPGLTLASDGTLSGTPTANGTYSFDVVVTDASPNLGGASPGPYFRVVAVSLTVQNQPPVAGPATATVAYNSNNNPITLALSGGTATSVAVGTAAAHGNAVASGTSITYTPTPGYAGPDSFTYTATNGAGTSAPGVVSLTVSTPTITYPPTGATGAIAGVAYSHSLASASGGAAPYSYQLESGSLPAGMSLAANGTLSGTPAAVGSFTFQVKATDSSTGTGPFSSAPASVTLTIAAPTISINPTTMPDGSVNTAYSQTLTASGGNAPYSYAISSGALPTGLSLSSAGLLSGTPTQSGTFNFSVMASDTTAGAGMPYHGTQAYSLTINGPTITVAPAALDDGTVGDAYSATLTASGGTAPYAFAVTGGALPAGISLGGGTLSGTPTAAGSFGFTVTATDAQGFTGSRGYTLVVAAIRPGAPTIGTATAGSGQASVSFTAPASNGGATISSYTVTSSPGGITATGAASPITVTGLSNGIAYTFTVTATNSAGTSASSSASNSVTPQATQTITFNNPGAQNFGTTPTLTATASSGLQVTFDSSTTPVCTVTSTGQLAFLAPGTCAITARQNGDVAYLPAPVVSQFFAVVVPGGAVSFGTPASLAVATGGTAYSQTITAVGGATPYSFSLVGGSLPSGLSLSSAGVLSGVPAVNGTFNITVRVTDSASQTAERSYALTVNAPPIALTPTSLGGGTAGSPYAQTLSASGGTAPYSYAVTGGALPAGVVLSPTGVLAGTPSVAGTFGLTVTATDALGFQCTQAYTLVTGAPTIALTPTSLPTGTAGSPYAQTLSASGGTAPYSYAVTAGALPAGVNLAAATGALAGTPTVAGTFNLTVTATDQLGFQATQAYSLAIGQPAPVAVADSASVNANGTATFGVTGNDSGPITSIAITRQPAHGTATVSGLGVAYTPAHDYFGSDSLAYVATGPGGTSAAAEVAITVVPGAVPVVADQRATVLAGNSVTIHLAANASHGPFTAAAITTPPASGATALQGTDLVYTADATASGSFGLDYTVSNAFGASQPAHLTLTVNPRPVAPTLSASVIAGTTVQVDLTATAQGGPFTAAHVLSVSPADAGTATVQASAQGYTLAFAAAAGFGGVAQVSYTLANAYATSEPGVVNVTVIARSDPSKDAEVMGILDAQADAARRMASGQIGNFQRRMESLHGGRGAGGTGGFSNGITLGSASAMRNATARGNALGEAQHVMGGGSVGAMPEAADPAPATPAAAGDGNAPGGIAFWSGGAINFGKMQPGASSGNGIDFSTSGLSLGGDKWISPSLALGLGLGYGHDDSDIGSHGSRSRVDGYNVAVYGSYQPTDAAYLDAMVGYQWLQFDARRYVTDNGSLVHGSRDGNQWFASLSTGYRFQADATQLTPYGRLDMARASLDGYAETGDAIYALGYQSQTIRTSTATLGLLGQWTVKRDYGLWTPQLRAEYGRDIQGSNYATMRYLDVLNGPLYQATLRNQSRDHGLLGAGIALQTLKGWQLRAEYQANLDDSSRDNQSILLGVEKKLQP